MGIDKIIDKKRAFMKNEEAFQMIDSIAASLDKTQKNAIDTGNMTQHILEMSDKEMHDRVVDTILKDTDLTAHEKMDLIRKENAYYDYLLGRNTRRVMLMQRNQTQCINGATRWCKQHWLWVLLGVAAFGFTVCALINEEESEPEESHEIPEKVA